jgi:ADP-L-glycero-D-manno-heptose 6-epimerase
MRILITGYKGFIGQNMVKALADHELSLYEWGEPAYDLAGLDMVIHLGAISDTRCQDWPALKQQNVDFTTTLIERCQKYGIPLQIASSASVYGPDNTTFKESDPVAPANMYAWSKALVEQYFHEMTPTSPVQLFRYFNVYGPHEDHKGDQASPFHKFREQAKTGAIKIFEGSADFKRDFVPVQTVIDVHKAFFNVPQSGIWNVGTGIAKSFLLVAKEIGGPIVAVPMPSDLKLTYQRYTQADLGELHKMLGDHYDRSAHGTGWNTGSSCVNQKGQQDCR